MKKRIYVFMVGALFLNFVFADNILAEKKKDLQMIQIDKNGFFVGVEAVLGDSYIIDSQKKVTFDLGVLGGYQRYFDIEQKHGIKGSVYLHSGFGNKFDMPAPKYGTSSVKAVPDSKTYIPLKFGFDVKYLWDFFQKGKQTLGLSVGLGYEADWFFDTTPVPATPASKYAKYTTPSTPNKNLFVQDIYPVIGIHYYYSHHQFELLSKFLQTNLSHVVNGPILIQSYLTFNYSYRF
ncbi:hypothetical protein [Helicobacter sp. 13S00477-4]|uniref:hypothetical protein n=1 Tax=Helicobacter sp. 13S00477-4 TaxID=1905759 RepID=UPI000BA7A98C|nr:hypothetical protein [Helicobacter sp. 13S00477-4]PAF52779.1 hypothetical protein BKH44_00930 [Helicobacter sp. 13S00477-4]